MPALVSPSLSVNFENGTVLSLGSSLDSTDSSKALRFKISKMVERELLVLGVQHIEVTWSILRTNFGAWLNVHEGLIMRLGLPNDLLPSGFPTKTLCTSLLSPIRATCPARFILLEFIIRTILGEEYRSLSSLLDSFFHSPVTSSLLGPNILLNILFSNTLGLRSSLNVSDQVSRP